MDIFSKERAAFVETALSTIATFCAGVASIPVITPDHNVSFFVAQQVSRCCDCGDIEAWRDPFRLFSPHVQEQIEQSLNAVDATPRPAPASCLRRFHLLRVTLTESPFPQNYLISWVALLHMHSTLFLTP
ncbi:hypothetical protein M405DRAFT_879266 [Rhizopogon salebrosus TDB-379]|nr:hypothetical protein M405DRAFT_879266 [Rhizopogon salebrosus TDB-379]